jgi:hypothetical protein
MSRPVCENPHKAAGWQLTGLQHGMVRVWQEEHSCDLLGDRMWLQQGAGLQMHYPAYDTLCLGRACLGDSVVRLLRGSRVTGALEAYAFDTPFHAAAARMDMHAGVRYGHNFDTWQPNKQWLPSAQPGPCLCWC